MNYLEIQASKEFQQSYDSLNESRQKQLHELARVEYRTNTFDPLSQTIKISEDRLQAFKMTQILHLQQSRTTPATELAYPEANDAVALKV